ncbi:MAG: hypothetical protein ABW277_04005 [Longimicrobiaceae bacterium]
MAIREGRWDCTSCGSTGVLGRHVDCPGCGRPRPEGTRFYLSDDAPVVVDPERLAEARAGADWACARCGGTNRASLAECGGCGAPREGAAPAPPEPASPVPSAEPVAATPAPPADAADLPAGATDAVSAPIGLEAAIAALPAAEVPPDRGAAPPRPPTWPLGLARARKRDYAVTLPFILLAVWVGIVQVARYRESIRMHPAVVVDKEWRRSLWMQRHDTVEEAFWTVPESAVVVRKEKQLHHHERVRTGYRESTRSVPTTTTVQDGYDEVETPVTERVQTGSTSYTCGQKDLGNGYFEDVTCSRPVYESRTATRTERRAREREVTSYETVTHQVPVYEDRPVYADWYVYRVPRWRISDSIVSASRTAVPAWPALPARDSTRYRLYDRKQWILVTVVNGAGERVKIEVDSATWKRFRPGQRVAYRVPDFLRIDLLPADSLPECRSWHAGRGEAPPASLGCSPRRARAR